MTPLFKAAGRDWLPVCKCFKSQYCFGIPAGFVRYDVKSKDNNGSNGFLKILTLVPGLPRPLYLSHMNFSIPEFQLSLARKSLWFWKKNKKSLKLIKAKGDWLRNVLIDIFVFCPNIFCKNIKIKNNKLLKKLSVNYLSLYININKKIFHDLRYYRYKFYMDSYTLCI